MKKHSALSNELWLLKRLVGYEKYYPLLLVSLIAANLLLPLVSTLLPATAVAALTRGGGMGQYLTVIGGFVVLYATILRLRDWLENQNTTLRRSFHKEICVGILMEKALTVDYAYLESPDGQRDLSAAKNTVSSFWVEDIEEVLYNVEPWLRNLLGLILYGAAATILDWRILLVLVGMTIANFAVEHLVQRYAVKTQEERVQRHRERGYLFQQSDDPANGKDIRLYHMEKWFVAALRGLIQKQWDYRRGRIQRRMVGKLSDTIFLALRDVLAYTVLVSAVLSGQIDAAGFTFSLGVLSTLTTWLNEFILTHNNLTYYSIGFNHFRNFMDKNHVSPTGGNANVASVRHPPKVELRDVTFTYPGAETPSIDQLFLTLEPGEKIALVGLNGAGKTTLVKLLNGLYHPDSGEILIDGVPMEQFDKKEYFRLIGTVFQDVNLLPFTIAENVAGQEQYDSDLVWDSLEKAGLRQVVEALPKGLHTSLTQQMEKDGLDLSGGQRQRLSFARALYKNAPILIMDEPTAALDPLAEADLYQKFASETNGKTSVFISHRLGSTRFCDRVIYMDKGRIAEMGTHRELLARGGAYARLFEVQSSWYIGKKEKI